MSNYTQQKIVLGPCGSRLRDDPCKFTKNSLSVGLRPNPLGELTALPKPSSWNKGGATLWRRREGRKGRKGSEAKEGNGRAIGRRKILATTLYKYDPHYQSGARLKTYLFSSSCPSHITVKCPRSTFCRFGRCVALHCTVKPRLHDTTGYQTGWATVNRFDNRLNVCLYTMQPVVQPVECLYRRYNRLFSRLSNRLNNRLNNRLQRVNKHSTGCSIGLTVAQPVW